MMPRLTRIVLVLVWLALWPAGAFAQGSSIAGTVKDSSGGVLPGVTVEVSSPALIEKTRTAVTDSNGLYRVIDLVPGVYTVTCTLPGFNTAKREGIELTANFTAPVNMEMTVGALEETVTVTGAAPIVDTTSVGERTAMPRSFLDSIPTGRNVTAVGVLIPGASTKGPGSGGAGGSDVGGSNGISKQYLRYHGLGDTMTLIDGMRSNAPSGGDGDNSQYYWPDGMIAELNYTTSDGTAQYPQGGLINSIIPKDGGNVFHGTVFGNYTNGSLNTNNFGDLGSRALTPDGLPTVIKIWDFNPSIGGPIKRDRLWLFYMFRHWGVNKTVANCVNVSGGGVPCEDPQWIRSNPGVFRTTWQISQKNKLVSYFDKQAKTRTNYGITALIPTDASGYQYTRFNYVGTLKFTSTVTNKMLFEAGTSISNLVYANTYKPGTPTDIVSVQDLDTGVWGVTWNAGNNIRHWKLRSSIASLSYVTGSHAFKTGMMLTTGDNTNEVLFNGDATLQTRGGRFVGAVLRNSPYTSTSLLNSDLGLFVQDQWAYKRATITGGIRFDYFNGSDPAQTAPAGTWVPARSYPEIPDVPNWKDISPRIGFAYDLFGNGKTALKAYFGRYVIAGGNTQFAEQANPLSSASGASDTRSWTDPNGDGIIQASELGPSSNANFGLGVLSQRLSDDVRAGWNVRPYLWEYVANLQHEILPRVGLNVGFHRNVWHNWSRAVNTLRSLSDYEPFTIVSPYDGAEIQMYDVIPARRPIADNVVQPTPGVKQTYVGADVTLQGRFLNGGMVQGGVSIGRVASHGVVIDDPNNCAGSFYGATRFCDITPPLSPEYKFVGSYPLPWNFVGSGALQIVRGPEIRALYNVTSAIARPTLGRNLSGSAIAVDLIPRYTQFGDTLKQLDLRLARVFSLGRYRLQGMLDVYNVGNSNAVGTEFTTWGSRWRQPVDVTVGRLAKVGVQFDF